MCVVLRVSSTKKENGRPALISLLQVIPCEIPIMKHRPCKDYDLCGASDFQKVEGKMSPVLPALEIRN